MSKEMNEKVYVVGHRNPDTDSICSAIAYAELKKIEQEKRKNDGEEQREYNYIPCKAGVLSSETKYVLNRFGIESPQYLGGLHAEIADIELNPLGGLESNASIKRAWNIMRDQHARSLPVLKNNVLEGIVSVSDIAKSYMEEQDNYLLAHAKTEYANIAETLNGEIVVAGEEKYFDKGKVTIAASSAEIMENFLEESDLVILGDRFETHFVAIEIGAKCIVMCGGATPTKTIKKLAEESNCTIISTPYDTFTVSRLINQSIPISYFMTGGELVTFKKNDSIKEVEEIMKTNRFHNFPVVNNKNEYIGMISRRRLLNINKKKVVLVDHNERTQAVDGIEDANIMEIIDHHRIGGIKTLEPVYFRNQPVGCTATIVYQMYEERNVVPSKEIAGLLASAIISDTLMFRSPTCTPLDKVICGKLAEIAGVEVEELANSMFKAGSDLEGKTAEELLYQDFKTFNNEGYSFGVSQINALDREDNLIIEEKVAPVLGEIAKKQDLDMMFLMITNIAESVSQVLCYGEDADDLVRDAFHVDENAEKILLKGVLSRKKQFLPSFVESLRKANSDTN